MSLCVSCGCFKTTHGVVTTRGLGVTANTDVAQLLVAVDQEAILVTHNRRDFYLLHEAWLRFAARWNVPAQHLGILILPHGAETELQQTLATFLQSGLEPLNQCYRYRLPGRWERYDL